jgi:hypothetical protein
LLSSAGSEGALLTGPLAILCSIAVFLIRWLHHNTRILLVWLGVVVSMCALSIALLSMDNFFEVLLQLAKTVLSPDARFFGRMPQASLPIARGAALVFRRSGSRATAKRYDIGKCSTFQVTPDFIFHDLWLEIGVELGLIGNFYRSWNDHRRAFQRLAVGTVGSAAGKLLFCHLYFVANRGRVELFDQFSLIQMIFMAAYYYAMTRKASGFQSRTFQNNIDLKWHSTGSSAHRDR